MFVTERLRVRAYRVDDIAVLHRLIFGSSKVMEYALCGRAMALQEAINFASLNFRNSPESPGVVEELSTGAIVGFSGLMHCNALGERDFEIGFVLAETAWGRGYATELGLGQLRLGFGSLGCARLLALVHPNNRMSINVLQKLHFTLLSKTETRGSRLIHCLDRDV